MKLCGPPLFRFLYELVLGPVSGDAVNAVHVTWQRAVHLIVLADLQLARVHGPGS